jgi:S1-C subfamily serine protease
MFPGMPSRASSCRVALVVVLAIWPGLPAGVTVAAPVATSGAVATPHRHRHHHHPRHNWRMSEAAAAQAGVVDVTTQLADDGEAAGTGIVLTRSGEVLTNNHVISGGIDVKVSVPGGGTYPAHVVGTDVEGDVALLDVDGGASLSPATIGDSSKVAVGDRVSAIGNEGGRGGAPSVAPGAVTALHQSIVTTDAGGSGSEYLDDLIRSDANVQPGDSGGPLVNAAGKVIGMDTAATVRRSASRRRPQAFAIPINTAMQIVRGFAGDAPGGVPAVPAPVPAPVPVPLPVPVPGG